MKEEDYKEVIESLGNTISLLARHFFEIIPLKLDTIHDLNEIRVKLRKEYNTIRKQKLKNKGDKL